MKARVLALLGDAVELWQQREAARAVLDEDLFVAELAASFITPDHLGDEEHAALAVHTARLLLKHARRDQAVFPVEGAGGKPS